MARNSIGKNLQVSSFGESHGDFVGCVIDGFPSNFVLDQEKLTQTMRRRRPGQSHISTSRNESDSPEIISGVFEGKTLGSPITILIKNNDVKSQDYSNLKDNYRPGHADALYDIKYKHRDHRGGGRSSARITAGWVAAGALAQQYLDKKNIIITSWVMQIHNIIAPRPLNIPNKTDIESNVVRCWHATTAKKMISAVESAKSEGDSLGGIIACMIENLPQGLGEPIFGKLQSVLGQYILNINAVKGISFGEGFNSVRLKGSEHNDEWIIKNNDSQQQLGTKTNHSGGIIGGMATGEPIYMEIAFKPTSTIAKKQNSVNRNFETTTLEITGRHDPCVLPRAVPIVEAMSALAIMDLLLESKNYTKNPA